MRPDFIAHWSKLEDSRGHIYRGDTEEMGLDAAIGEKLGLTRIGIHHMRLKPGQRSSYPHAESAEEEFVFVVEGRPDVWIDGNLHALGPGDSVAFPAGTGISHSFLNNTAHEVRLIVIGEKPKDENRIRYPLHPAHEATRPDRWQSPPQRELGPHDGKASAPEGASNAKLDEGALGAAADVLDKYGRHHQWFGPKPWHELDPIGRDEFLDIVALIVLAYGGDVREG